ncbi:MAG: teichoic acid D-Ala incorporation-associated protein DltX [Chloroflexota bacterium]
MLTAYYLAILAALILMYGQGDFSSTEFVYQGF